MYIHTYMHAYTYIHAYMYMYINTLICSSTSLFTSIVILEGRPDPGFLIKQPVSSNLRRKLWIPTRLTSIPSACKILAIVGAFCSLKTPFASSTNTIKQKTNTNAFKQQKTADS